MGLILFSREQISHWSPTSLEVVGTGAGTKLLFPPIHWPLSRTMNGPIWSPATSGTEQEVWIKQLPWLPKWNVVSALKGPVSVNVVPSTTLTDCDCPFLLVVVIVTLVGYPPATHDALEES